MSEPISNIVREKEYKGIPYKIVFEGDYHWTVIAGGREICSSSSIGRVEDKFKAMVDTGLTFEEA